MLVFPVVMPLKGKPPKDDKSQNLPRISAHSVPMDVPSPRQSWMKSIEVIDGDSGLASCKLINCIVIFLTFFVAS